MAIPVALPGSSGVVFDVNDTCRYYGFSVRETAGAVATFRIREGTVTGTILDTVQLAPNESAREWYGPDALFCKGDVFYEKVAGTIEGSVRVG